MKIRAFQGLVPGDGFAERVPSVPYDVVDRDEAKALASGNPDSLLHVVRAEIDVPDDVSPYDDSVYAKAAQNFDALQERGALVREPAPSLYLYRQEMGGHLQTGLVAVCHIDDYRDDVIRKHERTRPAKEDDRTKLTKTLGANTGPVFLTYRGTPGIDSLVDRITSDPADTSVVAPDGVRHSVWRIADPAPLTAAFGAVPVAYVADGHHRSASAHRVGSELRAANPGHTGDEDYNWFLCVLFPGSQLNILGYHRVVSDLNGLSPEAFLAAAAERFEVSPADDGTPASPGECRLFLTGKWHRLAWDPASAGDDPVASLDVSVLQDRLLDPVLGINDPRTDERIDFVGGSRGTGELERRVNSGSAAAAFALHPVTVDQLMAISDAGAIMPPKSTWFEPKLRSGFFVHTFADR